MTTDTLQKANSLQKEIDDLKKHYEQILCSEDGKNPYDGEKSKIYVETNVSTNSKTLKSAFLPLTITQIVTLYLKNVEAEIARLEIEFSKLQ